MAGATEYEAFKNYARPIEAALNCITEAKLGHRFRNEVDQLQVLTFDHVRPVPLGRGQVLRRLHLEVTQHYRIVKVDESSDPRGPFHVRTAGYYYSISDHRGSEILVYHWHPEAIRGARDEPHLHIKVKVSSRNDPSLDDLFSDLHLPTERITIETVVRLLIEQFKVQPIKADWEDILSESEAAHRAYRSLPGNTFSS